MIVRRSTRLASSFLINQSSYRELKDLPSATMRAKKGTKLTRLRKGSKVEVFCTTKTIPGGFWRPVQIVCGNGRTYLVQYDHVPSSIKKTTTVEKVPRKMIRPCPPVKDKPVNWIREDAVEVFVHGSWRVGKVTGVAYGNNFCFVLPIGHAREIAVKACNLRRQQMWVNNKWILIKKDSPKASSGFVIKLKVMHKVMLGCSESTISSTGSCSASGRPCQYPVFSHNDDDDAISMIDCANK